MATNRLHEFQGNTADASVVVFDQPFPGAGIGSFSVKNEGRHPLSLVATFSSIFGGTDSVSAELAPGEVTGWNLSTPYGNVTPPYTHIKVEAKSARAGGVTRYHSFLSVVE